jgi:hypothetical protein
MICTHIPGMRRSRLLCKIQQPTIMRKTLCCFEVLRAVVRNSSVLCPMSCVGFLLDSGILFGFFFDQRDEADLYLRNAG